MQPAAADSKRSSVSLTVLGSYLVTRHRSTSGRHSQRDQRESYLLVPLSLQMVRGLHQDNLERRTDVGLQEVAAPGCAVGPAKHYVGVQLRFSALFAGNVTH